MVLVNYYPRLNDKLMYRESGLRTRRKDYLPPDKQYLVTRRVPCRHRPKALEREAANETEQIIAAEGDGEEAWVATHTDRQTRHTKLVKRIPFQTLKWTMSG